MILRVLDLFSGIGGFSLGLERTGGFRTVAFCECDPYARRVLSKRWPEVPCYDDIRTLTADKLAADGIVPDVLCGGFPCQDISLAGNGAGIEGERSGLWSEYARLIGEVRPRYAIMENVAALLGRGLGRVLGDLSEIGYDAEWHCIPASYVGAPHRRDRVWIVAYPASDLRGASGNDERDALNRAGDSASLADAIRNAGHAWRARDAGEGARGRDIDRGSERAGDVADAAGTRCEGAAGEGVSGSRRASKQSCGRGFASHADSEPPIGAAIARQECGQWETEPNVGRVAHGIPARVDRLKCLGNAVVPQVVELIGRTIVEGERAA